MHAGITRFATDWISAERVLELKPSLKQVVTSPVWCDKSGEDKLKRKRQREQAKAEAQRLKRAKTRAKKGEQHTDWGNQPVRTSKPAPPPPVPGINSEDSPSMAAADVK